MKEAGEMEDAVAGEYQYRQAKKVSTMLPYYSKLI
jgi:hypothetical protein